MDYHGFDLMYPLGQKSDNYDRSAFKLSQL